ncbi:MAG: phospholipase D-like domain-containing protein, partial [Bacillota bacterium]
MSQPWISGNKFTLLENGEAFFPRVCEAVANARSEVLIETFILREDKAGRGLHAAMLKAARRGVQVGLTVDGFGSHALSPEFLGALVNAGVRVHMFAPVSRFLRRISYFRRLHRKLVVVDGRRAFVGGINFTDEHLVDDGPGTKQDYAVETEGPVVAEIHRFMHDAIAAGNPAPCRLPCR